jgi:hypothetical protein
MRARIPGRIRIWRATRTLLDVLGAERNIGVFSTDIDSRDFKLHKPEDVIKSVMSQLEKHGKGIILVHDFKHHRPQR